MNKGSCSVHLTNIVGIGASQLAESLLPALEADDDFRIDSIFLPEQGNLSEYESANLKTKVFVYSRFMPNALSRVLECILLSSQFDGDSPLLVLGDLPLRCRSSQTVFVQTPHLLRSCKKQSGFGHLKYIIARWIFKFNSSRVNAFIVQTEVMRTGLEGTYPNISGRVHVVPQPVPNWLLSSGLKRSGRVSGNHKYLNMIYPAAGYPHKNHQLLSKIDGNSIWPIDRLQITLDEISNPAPNLPWLFCRGFLSPQEMIKAYSHVDALLFLSKEESYGFPLVEAMYTGLPIICPDLPYAHVLCGEEAIYFDPNSVDSLKSAVGLLKSRLEEGWWPNWDEQMKCIPKDWNAVAHRMLQIAAAQNLEN